MDPIPTEPIDRPILIDPPLRVPEPLRRLTEPAYADGVSEPRAGVPADLVALTVFTQGEADIPSPEGLSALWIFWGQFIDHDLSLTPEQHGPTAEILKPAGPFAPAPVVRSVGAPGTGETTPREQLNEVSAPLDASMVYGSVPFRTLLLRSFEGGRLQTQPGPDGMDLLPDERELFVPFLDDALAADYQAPAEEGFAAGDIRASENPGLAAVHALLVNEHNHWAGRIAETHPEWHDEEIFRAARAAVETVVQRITYEEFLPPLIGDALPAHDGHDPAVSGQISNEFATAAYRFGHTAIPETFRFLAEDGTETAEPVPLFETFENDDILLGNGARSTLRGLLETPAQALDTKVVDSLNLLLFTEDGGLTGFSLPERNILRGRDHGLDGWLSVRAQVLGDVDAGALAGSADFSAITSDPEVQAALAAVYPTLGDVDLWVGGLAEDAAPGAAIGPTFQAIIAEQFAATRASDPSWGDLSALADPALAAEVMATGMAEVLARSAGIEHVQRDPFRAADRHAGTDGPEIMAGSEGRDLMMGQGGDDYLKGGGEADDLFGEAGADMLRGGAGGDGLDGGADGDRLMGGAGADRLAGGAGTDLLLGGAGPDVFVFRAGETGVDCLADFEAGADRIELRGFGPDAQIAVEHRGYAATLSVDGVPVAEIWGRGQWGLEDAVELVG